MLDSLGIRYELRAYEVDLEDLTAVSVARKIGMPVEQVFKTLLTVGRWGGALLCGGAGGCGGGLQEAGGGGGGEADGDGVAEGGRAADGVCAGWGDGDGGAEGVSGVCG